MSTEINSQQSQTRTDNAPNASPRSTSVDPDDENQALRKALRDVLKEIPYFGKYILIVESNWGCTGVLFILAGFVMASGLVFTGFYPPFAVSPALKGNALPSALAAPAPAAPVYELKVPGDVKLEAAVDGAQNRVWASGVALSKLDPRILVAKVKAGVSVRLVYADPCGEAVKKRQVDENNPSATRNIASRLTSLDNYLKQQNLSESQKSMLQVKLLDVYPTMAVIIIDDDLYAYFCRYGDVCSSSPVLVFTDYMNKKPKDAAAEFFESHFNAGFEKSRTVTNYAGPCNP